MSYQETVVGKLKRVGDLNEALCVALCEDNGWEMNTKLYDDFSDLFRENCYERYYIRDCVVYEIIKEEDCEGQDVFNVLKSGDDEYAFTLSYYNGGCCFDEALDCAFDKLNKKEQDNG